MNISDTYFNTIKKILLNWTKGKFIFWNDPENIDIK